MDCQRTPSIALLAAALCAIATAAFAQPTIEGVVKPGCGTLPRAGATGASRWTTRIHHTGARFLRLRFTGIELSGNNVTIVVQGLSGDPRLLPLDEIRSGHREWTRVFEGDRVDVTVKGAASGRIGIDCAIQQDGPRQFSVTLPNDLKVLWELASEPGIARAARTVGKLAFMKDGLPASCTGFLIASNLMVTNRHCIDSQPRCDTAMVLFGYEQSQQGDLTAEHQEDCLDYIDTKASVLDVAVIRVSGAPGAAERFGTLTLRDGDLPADTNELAKATAGMFVVSHPGGAAKMVTKANCSITTPLAVGDIEKQESDFGHQCDVSDGSSGAPVLDADSRVIGIHHLGFDSSGRWDRENRAVRIESVRQILKELLAR